MSLVNSGQREVAANLLNLSSESALRRPVVMPVLKKGGFSVSSSFERFDSAGVCTRLAFLQAPLRVSRSPGRAHSPNPRS
jgi:hypothetical protein